MSGTIEACDRLREAAREPLAGIAAAARDARTAQAALQEADDLMEMLAATANLIVAFEALQDASKHGEAALRASLAKVMADTGCTEFETTGHTVSISKGRSSVEIVDPGAVPADLMTTPAPAPDKKKIAQFLKGKTVNWARVITGGPILTIRNGA